MKICGMTQGTKERLCNNLEGWDGEEDGREVQEGEDIVILWLIHVNVWHKIKKKSVKQLSFN